MADFLFEMLYRERRWFWAACLSNIIVVLTHILNTTIIIYYYSIINLGQMG